MTLLFDVSSLATFVAFYFTLPSRPDIGCSRPLLPWGMSLVALTAIFFAGPGVVGVGKMSNPSLIGDGFGRYLALPLLVTVLVTFLGLGWFFLKRVVQGWSKERRRNGALLKRTAWTMLGLPGLMLDYVMLLFVAIGFSFSLYPLLGTQGFANSSATVQLINGVSCVLLGWMLFNKYRTLIVPTKRRFIADVVLTVLYIVVAVTWISFFFVNYLGVETYDASQLTQMGRVIYGTLTWDALISLLPIGVISAILYLVLRWVAYFSYGKRSQIELDLEWASNK